MYDAPALLEQRVLREENMANSLMVVTVSQQQQPTLLRRRFCHLNAEYAQLSQRGCLHSILYRSSASLASTTDPDFSPTGLLRVILKPHCHRTFQCPSFLITVWNSSPSSSTWGTSPTRTTIHHPYAPAEGLSGTVSNIGP